MVSQGNISLVLCEDVIVNILSRLPEKDLIICKCVSKEWHKVISNICVPRLSVEALVSGIYFRVAKIRSEDGVTCYSSKDEKDRFRKQVSHGDQFIECASLFPSSSGAPILDGGVGFVGMSYASLLPFNPSVPDFLDSCNGLILFVQHPKPQFYVCNPAIEQCVPIPFPRFPIRLPSLYASLAFDPSESIHYRVVILSLSTQPQCVLIFYSKIGEWISHEVQLASPDSSQCFKLVRYSVYFKGSLYRLSMFNKILRFDLKSLKASFICCPDKNVTPFQGCIGVSNGCFYHAKNEELHIRVWSLDNSSEPYQWSLRHEVSLIFIARLMEERYMEMFAFLVWLHPCAFHPKRDVIFLTSAYSLVMYDPGRSMIELVKRTGFNHVVGARYFSIFTYSRNLVTLKNWCRETTAEIDGCELTIDCEGHDFFSYMEQ